MNGRATSWAAWGAWGVTALTAAPTVYLASLNEVSSLRNEAFVCVLICVFSTVGALISSRRPDNAIGWLFCSGSLVWMLGELVLEYAVYALIPHPGTLPLSAWVGWFGNWARGFGWLVIVTFLLLLFPNGRLPSGRWRPVAWLLVLYMAFYTVAVWVSPVSNDLRLASVQNPIGFGGAFAGLLTEAMYLSLPFPLLISGAAVVSRFRCSVGVERQQIKWFTYAVSLMVGVCAVWLALAIAGLVEASPLTFALPMLGLPVAVGVAILRHRLYDIDFVINLTLVYASLTAVLGGVYVGGVVLLQYALRTFAGGDSQLVVVASTLAIAALFNPLRQRIQALVDRSFYRDRYDARRTLDGFGRKLRDEMDLDALGGELLTAVRTTVRPEYTSLWLSKPRGSR